MADWRNRQVVYQVFVDRFAASGDPRSRASLYAPPRRLMAWNDRPTKGPKVEGTYNYRHELDFWGGDLRD